MKNILMAVGISISAALSIAVAQDEAPSAPMLTKDQATLVDRLIDQGLEDERAWEILESLTTKVGPRLGGSEAEARARDWGVETLKDLGFKNVRIEEFTDACLVPHRRKRSNCFAVSARACDSQRLASLRRHQRAASLLKLCVFARYPSYRRRPWMGLKARSFFVDEPMARTQDGSGYGTAVAKRSQAAIEAEKRGAVAALIRSAGHRQSPQSAYRWIRQRRCVAGATFRPLRFPIRMRINWPVQSDLPMSRVRVQLNIQTGWEENATSGNVVGEIPGDSDELIVIGGHLDSWDNGTGAIDDGAGIEPLLLRPAKLVDELPR